MIVLIITGISVYLLNENQLTVNANFIGLVGRIRNFLRFLTSAVDENIFHRVRIQTVFFLSAVLQSTLRLLPRMPRKMT